MVKRWADIRLALVDSGRLDESQVAAVAQEQMDAVREQVETAVTISSESLGILLEYAYRGEAALGGNCRNEREAGCAMCDTLTEAEAALGGDAPTDPNWWTAE